MGQFTISYLLPRNDEFVIIKVDYVVTVILLEITLGAELDTVGDKDHTFTLA